MDQRGANGTRLDGAYWSTGTSWNVSLLYDPMTDF